MRGETGRGELHPARESCPYLSRDILVILVTSIAPWPSVFSYLLTCLVTYLLTLAECLAHLEMLRDVLRDEIESEGQV